MERRHDCKPSKSRTGALPWVVGRFVPVAVDTPVLRQMLQCEQSELNHPRKRLSGLFPRDNCLAGAKAKRHSEAVLGEPIALPPFGKFGADHRAPPMFRNWTSNGWTFRAGSLIASLEIAVKTGLGSMKIRIQS